MLMKADNRNILLFKISMILVLNKTAQNRFNEK